ncbi:hypothetical protein BXZ70DRAFT_929233 [Cristinia sonorae]|uniref:Uncharacterized protein n=1 Tax=Cristinia sonorae TaxID=1940300 RepID=A0A8K0XRI5_9AGAR|nr:hypothetical protein BXZ70DRAFT_929233 [Cristinia sonorae]
MSPLLSLPPWRGPVRQKSSTPFFPGAWPGSPSTACSNGSNVSDDIEALKHIGQRTMHNDTIPALPHLDRVADFHRRISQSYDVRPPNELPPRHQVLNVDIPQSPHLTGLSDFTDQSTSPSESLPTPEQAFHPDFSFIRSNNAFLLDVNQQDTATTNKPPRPIRNPSRASSVASKDPDVSRTTITDSPLIRFRRLARHPQAFSSPTDTSYDSPGQRSTGSRSFYDTQTSSSRSAQSEFHRMSGFASSFFPLADRDSECGLLSPSTLNSTRAADTDSPVLPADDSSTCMTPALLYAAQPRVPNLNPSSVELDAFGIAASNIMVGAHSTIESIPTSFRTTSELDSMGGTAQGHARRQSSVSLSLSLDMSSENDSIHRASRFRQVCDSQYHLPKDRKRRTPSPALSFAQQTGTTRTTSKVIAAHARSATHDAAGKANKTSTLDKMKKFGGRIRKLFTTKTPLASAAESEIGVRTHTAVTAVEYTSEHPIPKHGSNAPILSTPRSIAQSFLDLDPRKRRRQSMPATTGSTSNVTRPKPLRPVSLLATKSLNRDTSRYPSMSNLIGFSPPHSRLPPPPTSRRMSAQMEPLHITRPINRVPAEMHSRNTPIASFAGRSRTQTAPQTMREARDADPRMSLTSALGDAIRTTVIPHPPLPQHAIPPSSYHQHQLVPSRTRRASTNANDAWDTGRLRRRHHDWDAKGTHKEHVGYDKKFGGPLLVESEIKPLVLSTTDVGRGGSTHSEIQSVARDTSTDAGKQPAPTRARSQTQSTVQEPRRTRQHFGTEEPRPQSQPPTKRRSRGFSLSSAISKRAMRARSIIAGRSDEASLALSTPPPLPFAELELKPSGGTTSVSGVSFDMLTSGDQTIPAAQTNHHPVPGHRHRDPETLLGCTEYEPDLVLDRMSFATTEIQSTPVSSMDLNFIPQSQAVIADVHPIGITISANTSSSTFAEDDGVVDVDEREEEREFMRTLGLEFDEIVRRARDVDGSA